jgi:hypothetical protein
MGEYLRETLKMLQAEPCEDIVSREDVIKAVDRHTFNTDDGLCLDEDVSIIMEELPPVKPAACIAKVNFSKEDVIKAIDRHTFDTDDGLCLDEDISIIIEELPPVTPVQRWIPVSERLPKERGVYIVTEKVFSVTDREHTGRFNLMTEQVEFGNGKWRRAKFFEVIAWMPLPEPYKESEEK